MLLQLAQVQISRLTRIKRLVPNESKASYSTYPELLRFFVSFFIPFPVRFTNERLFPGFCTAPIRYAFWGFYGTLLIRFCKFYYLKKNLTRFLDFGSLSFILFLIFLTCQNLISRFRQRRNK